MNDQISRARDVLDLIWHQLHQLRLQLAGTYATTTDGSATQRDITVVHRRVLECIVFLEARQEELAAAPVSGWEAVVGPEAMALLDAAASVAAAVAPPDVLPNGEPEDTADVLNKQSTVH